MTTLTPPTKPLTNDDFFTRLADLFESRRNKGHGSIYLTQKCLNYTPPQTTQPSEANTTTSIHDFTPTGTSILIRATDGKSGTKGEKRQERVKISTVVEAEGIEAFFARYADVCKGGMGALKKRDRSKKKRKGKKEGVVGVK